MARNCKCVKCGMMFDRDKIPFIQVSSRRYAHQSCMTGEEIQNLKEYQRLETYIKSLFGIETLTQKISKSIIEYVDVYGYTYYGIEMSLRWFFEIQKNPLEKANNGIGIVPYVYEQARDYYTKLDKINKANDEKIKNYNGKYTEVTISMPRAERRIKLMWEDE